MALTGTPGTGKTAIAGELARLGWECLCLRSLIEAEGLGTDHDQERDTTNVEVEALARAAAVWLARKRGLRVVIEGHLAHELGLAVLVVVLRCDPFELARRLEGRQYPPAKVRENCEAEALDVILVESLEAARGEEKPGREAVGATEKVKVAELDTTGLEPATAAGTMEAWVEGDSPVAIRPPGTARWLPKYLEVE